MHYASTANGLEIHVETLLQQVQIEQSALTKYTNTY